MTAHLAQDDGCSLGIGVRVRISQREGHCRLQLRIWGCNLPGCYNIEPKGVEYDRAVLRRCVFRGGKLQANSPRKPDKSVYMLLWSLGPAKTKSKKGEHDKTRSRHSHKRSDRARTALTARLELFRFRVGPLGGTSCRGPEDYTTRPPDPSSCILSMQGTPEIHSVRSISPLPLGAGVLRSSMSQVWGSCCSARLASMINVQLVISCRTGAVLVTRMCRSGDACNRLRSKPDRNDHENDTMLRI